MGRLDRYGEPIEDAPETNEQMHARLCRDGFLGEDEQGRPIVCLKCRPHLEPLLNRRRQRNR